ncbi:MAG: transcriptional regulator [Methylophaga sp.]|jgi:ArsR family transcriptional regulator|nr:transcriptional regulator [Methylophaga sp.]MAY17032.1 transcriptional regulator [Methylophaga sp.]MBN46179.1 transcriptional regulator [Methylophaga sp.]HAO24650.1 transcriptional regulator [Methylophaga sp.]|tara:strand:+ start:25673 stop:26038 length:366 start_codon:yes stop_codon:yes gene_type:complete
MTVHRILEYQVQSCSEEHQQRNCSSNEPSVQQLERTAALFKALGDPSRLTLLYRLRQGELCVGDLVTTENKLSTVSARLQTLLNANLVTRRRDARHLYYRLADQHVVEMIENALAHANESN